MTPAEAEARLERLRADPTACTILVCSIHNLLWPASDPDREWSPDTLEAIGAMFQAALPARLRAMAVRFGGKPRGRK